MTKFVVSSALISAAASALEAEVVALIQKHAGQTAGEVATLVGAGIMQVVQETVKPNAADAGGLPLSVTTAGKTTATDAEIEAGAALATEAGEAELSAHEPIPGA